MNPWRVVITKDQIAFSREPNLGQPTFTGAYLRRGGEWRPCVMWSTHARRLKVPEHLIESVRTYVQLGGQPK